MVAEPWIYRMRIQVGSNLKHSTTAAAAAAAGELKAPPENTIGILSFEVASSMSKAVHLYKSLSPSEVSRLRSEVFRSQAVRHLVSGDESHLLKLVAAEKLEELNRVAAVVSRLGKRCTELALVGFEHVYADLLASRAAAAKLDLSAKDMEAAVKRMERYVASTATLYAELEVLGDLEHGAKKLQLGQKQQQQLQQEEALRAYKQKIQCRRHELKHLREVSLWNQTHDKIVGLMSRAVCTIYARIRLVFGQPLDPPARPPPAAAASALNPCGSTPVRLFGECLSFTSSAPSDEEEEEEGELLRSLIPATAAAAAGPSTVGGSALALHYANVIIIIEKLLRDDLYQMLPTSLRLTLRVNLRAYGKDLAIYDGAVAHDWKGKLEKILAWLSPMAHNMIRWQTERNNFEQQQHHQIVSKVNILLLQTLHFADRVKTEAAICELLVGLNYICRYEHQQNALLDCASSVDFDHCVDWQL
ncbi:unnamed protein product [Spirodela intermedia]|uniref:Uncharacterized protein n=1 Tax=Spirodela intermedia TaxID=51605 RepID=A0A7I8IEE9_SPIIN|nr:unnamed protein product [Spirodela intermedia]CAA6655473.1 unnamed protein product [Spirodela intermedia]